MANEVRIPNGLALDFIPADAGGSDQFILKDPSTGLTTKLSSVPASRISGAGNLTELTSGVLNIVGGTGSVLGNTTIQVIQATTSTSGYISNTDWNTFNNKLSSSLASGNLYVGNGSGVATDTAITGDITISATGVAGIASGVIVNADVNSSAAIAFSKMEGLTADRVLISTGGIVTASAISTTILNFLSTVSSNVQDQLNNKDLVIVGLATSDIVRNPQAAHHLWSLVWDNSLAQWTLSASGGGGTIVGPGSSTDNAIPRWNGTGGNALKNSGIIIDDSNNITAVNSIDIASSGLKLRDADLSHNLIVTVGSNLTLDRSLTFITGDASRVITLTGDTTLDDWFDQEVKTTSNSVFNSITVSNAGGLHVLDSDASHDLIISTGSNLTADRTLFFNTGDVSRTLTINASGTVYVTGGTDVALADGGTGTSLSDPNYDSVYVWDNYAKLTRLPQLSGLSYDTYTNTLTVAGGDVRDTDVNYFEQDDFIGHFATILQGRWVTQNHIVGSSGVGIDTTENAFGVAGAETTTSTTGIGSLSRNNFNNTVLLGGGSSFVIRFRAALPTLSDGTDTYTFWCGFHDLPSTSGNGTDGVFFRYTHSVNSGKFEGVCRVGGVETAVDTGVAPTAGVYDILKISVNGAGTSVEFHINGTLTNTVTTNIPTGTNLTNIAGKIEKSAGTSTRFFLFDWYDLNMTRSTPR